MKIVTQVKLLPSPGQAAALRATLRAANRAADAVSVTAFENQVFSRNDLQRMVYGAVKAEIVTEAERTGKGIALEDLSGIRNRARLRKPQQVALHSWAFHQLGSFLAYKAQRAGVALVYVDPAYTSQSCADCHHIEKKNRVSQALFVCRSCGVVAHADRNASRNIARKGEAVWRAGRESRVPATP